MQELREKVIIVTGASAGIGRAAAGLFAAEGACVVLADIDAERGEAAAAELRDKGAEAIFVPTDVGDDAQVAALVARTLDRFGHLDGAFNNAGIEGASAPTHECTMDNWQRTLAVDLTGVFSCMRHEIPAMLASGGGSIVNCSSIAGLVGFPGIAAYVASKHGVIGLTKTAALEYGPQGIRVNAVCPGVIDTEMIDRFVAGDDTARAALTDMEPVGRIGSPDEIAEAAMWLCSDRSSFTTGQAIAIDGGFSAR